MPPRNIHPFLRRENRIPMEIPVVLDGHRHLPGTEATFTENVSAKGARVVSVRRWETGAPLVLASRTGEFRLKLGWLTAIRCVATLRGGGGVPRNKRTMGSPNLQISLTESGERTGGNCWNILTGNTLLAQSLYVKAPHRR